MNICKDRNGRLLKEGDQVYIRKPRILYSGKVFINNDMRKYIDDKKIYEVRVVGDYTEDDEAVILNNGYYWPICFLEKQCLPEVKIKKPVFLYDISSLSI